ncbi:hypothetical protein ABDF71_21525 [Ochrobactrum sp. WV_118_8]
MAKVSDALREPEIDPRFAKRMEIALDNHPRAPAMNAGRLTWLLNEMKMNGAEVTLQSIHRWYHGNAKPRSMKLAALSKVLGVDPTWLTSGKLPELDDRASRQFEIVGDGSVNCLIGFIQMAGWQCAIPDANDDNSSFVHFYAIVKGRQLRIHGSPASDTGEPGLFRFRFTNRFEKCLVLGVCRTAPFRIDVLPFTAELIRKHGEQKDGMTELLVKCIEGEYIVGNEQVDPLVDIEEALNL